MDRYRTYTPGDNPSNPAGDAELRGVFMTAPEAIPPGYVAEAINAVFDERRAQTRPGKRTLPWLNRILSQKLTPFAAVYGFGAFRDPNGRQWGLIAADGFIYRCVENNGIFSLTLPPGVRIAGPVNFLQAFSTLIVQQGQRLPNLVLDDIGSAFALAVLDWEPATAYVEGDLRAYGPEVEIASITLAGSTSTVVTTSRHQYETGDRVRLYHDPRSQLATAFAITVADDFTFTFNFSSPASALTPVAVTNTSAAGTATATSVAHGLVTGRRITISGAVQAEYNVTATVTVVDADTFTYAIVGAPASPATGTIAWLPVVYASRQTAFYRAKAGGALAGETPITTPSKWEVRTDFVAPWTLGGATGLANRVFYTRAFEDGTGAKDLIAASDTQSYLAIQAMEDVFRINQGDNDELIAIAPFNKSSLVAFKRGSIYLLTNLYDDLSNATLERIPAAYGCIARRSVGTVGTDLWFLSNDGVRSLFATAQGEVQGRDQRVSLPIDPLIRRLVSRLAGDSCAIFANGKYHLAVPLDDAVAEGVAGVGNNAILTYNTRTEAWEGVHQGQGIAPVEWCLLTLNGRERAFFASRDGCIYLWGEGRMDVVGTDDRTSGVTLRDIALRLVSRGYDYQVAGLKKFNAARTAVSTWNPRHTLAVQFEGVNDEQSLTDVPITKSRTAYDDPWDEPPFNRTNLLGDHGQSGRQDYSVALGAADSLYIPTEIELERDQASTQSERLRHGRRDRVAQLIVENTQGFLRVDALECTGEAGERTEGVKQ